MKRLKPFRRGLISFLSVIFLFSAAIVGATVKLYTATAEDYANEVESQDIAKLRARDKAIKNATKQAGVYLKSYSRSVNSELTDDEITAIASNAWELVGEPKYSRTVNQISDETTIIVWTATVEVNVDDSEIQKWIKRDEKDKIKIISQTKEANKSAEENESQIEDLREKYNLATSQSEKDRLRKQMNDADRDFLANQKNEEGLKLYYAEDYYGAIKLYREALKFNPNYAEAYNNRGICYDILGQNERAIQDFNKAIQINPNYSEAYDNRGFAYISSGQYELGIKDCKKAIEINIDNVSAYMSLSVAYVDLQNYDDAISAQLKVVELEIDNSETLSLNNEHLVWLYSMTRNYERSIEDYTKLIKNHTNIKDFYWSRASFYEKIGNAESALSDYTFAIELDTKNDTSYFKRASFYERLKNFEAAVKDYTKCIELDPEHSWWYCRFRADVYKEMKNFEAAIKDYTINIKYSPPDNYYWGYRYRADCYRELKNYNSAIEDYSKIIKIVPNEPDGYQLRGICYQQLGDEAKAQADFAKAKELGYKG